MSDIADIIIGTQKESCICYFLNDSRSPETIKVSKQG